MPDQPPPDSPDPDSPDRDSSDPDSVGPESAEPDWQRRRRLAAVFGDAMPDTTSDERAPETAEDASAEDAGDRWLRSQVPPHHG